MTIDVYDTQSNTVLAVQPFSKSILNRLIEGKTYNYILVKKNGNTAAQYVLNRKKDKWRRTV